MGGYYRSTSPAKVLLLPKEMEHRINFREEGKSHVKNNVSLCTFYAVLAIRKDEHGWRQVKDLKKSGPINFIN